MSINNPTDTSQEVKAQQLSDNLLNHSHSFDHSGHEGIKAEQAKPEHKDNRIKAMIFMNFFCLFSTAVSSMFKYLNA